MARIRRRRIIWLPQGYRLTRLRAKPRSQAEGSAAATPSPSAQQRQPSTALPASQPQPSQSQQPQAAPAAYEQEQAKQGKADSIAASTPSTPVASFDSSFNPYQSFLQSLPTYLTDIPPQAFICEEAQPIEHADHHENNTCREPQGSEPFAAQPAAQVQTTRRDAPVEKINTQVTSTVLTQTDSAPSFATRLKQPVVGTSEPPQPLKLNATTLPPPQPSLDKRCEYQLSLSFSAAGEPVTTTSAQTAERACQQQPMAAPETLAQADIRPQLKEERPPNKASQVKRAAPQQARQQVRGACAAETHAEQQVSSGANNSARPIEPPAANQPHLRRLTGIKDCLRGRPEQSIHSTKKNQD